MHCFLVRAFLIVLALPFLEAFSLQDVEHLKDELSSKHPEVLQWFERANERLKSGRNASPEDLEDVRQLLRSARQRVYDFVTSPMFTIATNVVIENSISKVQPFLGVMSLRDIIEFYLIIKRDPALQKIVYDEGPEFVERIPGGMELESWFTNKMTEIAADEFMVTKTELVNYLGLKPVGILSNSE